MSGLENNTNNALHLLNLLFIRPEMRQKLAGMQAGEHMFYS